MIEQYDIHYGTSYDASGASEAFRYDQRIRDSVRGTSREMQSSAREQAASSRQAARSLLEQQRAYARLDSSVERSTSTQRRHSAETQRSTRELERQRGAVGGLTNAVDRLNVDMQGLGNTTGVVGLVKMPALISAAGLAAQGLTAAAGGATALVAGLAPLSGLAVAGAAGLLAVEQATGVAKLAFKGLPEAIEGSEEAMKKLTPEGRRFARMVRGELLPEVKALQREAQRGLFPGLTRGLEAAMTQANVAVVRRGARQTGAALGRGAEQLGREAGRPEFSADLSTILTRNVGLIDRMSNATLGLAKAGRHLLVEAGPLTDWLGKLAQRGGEFLGEWAEQGRRSGELREFFRETREVMSDLGPLARDFGMGLVNIFKEGYPLGRRMLGDLRDSAKEFRAWTESTSGRNAIAEYFRDIQPPLYEAARLGRDFTKAMFELGRGDELTPLLQQMRLELLPMLTELVSGTTSDFAPVLIVAMTQVLRLFIDLSGSNGPLVLAVELFGDMAGAIATIIEEVPGLQGLVFVLAGMAAITKALRFSAMITGFTAMTRGMRGVQTQAQATTASLQQMNAAGMAGGAGVVAGGAARRGGFLGRVGRVSGAAAIGGSIVASVAGSAIGGRGGGILSNVGMGAGVGAMIGSSFGPVGTGLGALAGASVGLAASFISLKKKSSDVDLALSNVARNSQSLIAGRENLAFLRGQRTDARLQVRSAQMGWEGARAQLRQIEAGGVSGAEKAAYREAQLYAAQAFRNLQVAKQQLRGINAEIKTQMTANAQAVKRNWNAIALSMGDAGKYIRREIEQIPAAFTGAARQMRIDEIKGEGLKRFQADMRQMAANSEGQLRKVALAAIAVSKAIGGIPTRKQVQAYLRDHTVLSRKQIRAFMENRLLDRKTIEAIMRDRTIKTRGELERALARLGKGVVVPITARANTQTAEQQMRAWVTRMSTLTIAPGIVLGDSPSQLRPSKPPRRAVGGWVPGDPRSDSTLMHTSGGPVLASGGEFFVTAPGQRQAVAAGMAHPGLWDWLASNQLPHFARGGIVKRPPRGYVSRYTALARGFEAGLAGKRGNLPEAFRGIEPDRDKGKPASKKKGAEKTVDVDPKVAGTAYARMVAAANRIDAMRLPYAWGGGHGALGQPNRAWGKVNRWTGKYEVGFDCSGALSAVLGAGGFLSSPLTSGSLMGWGLAGAGKRVTVYANAGHTFMTLGGRFFGTTSQNPAGGAGWFGGTGTGGFAARHPKGMRRGGYAFNTGGRVTPGAVLSGATYNLRSSYLSPASIKSSLESIHGALSSMTIGAIESYRASILAQIQRLQRGPDTAATNKAVVNLRRALSLADFAVGRFVGSLARKADLIQQQAESQRAGAERRARVSGAVARIEGTPISGSHEAAGRRDILARQYQANQREVAQRERALQAGIRRGLPSGQLVALRRQLAEARTRMDDSFADLADAAADYFDAVRQAAADAAQQMRDEAQRPVDLANAGLGALQASQRMRGIENTGAAFEEIASYLETQMIPALRRSLQAARDSLDRLLNDDIPDSLQADAIHAATLAVIQADTDLANAHGDLAQSVRDAAGAASELAQRATEAAMKMVNEIGDLAGSSGELYESFRNLALATNDLDAAIRNISISNPNAAPNVQGIDLGRIEQLQGTLIPRLWEEIARIIGFSVEEAKVRIAALGNDPAAMLNPNVVSPQLKAAILMLNDFRSELARMLAAQAQIANAVTGVAPVAMQYHGGVLRPEPVEASDGGGGQFGGDPSDGVRAAAELAKEAAAAMLDIARSAKSLADFRRETLSLQQQLGDVYTSAAGIQARKELIEREIITALKGELEVMHKQQAEAREKGDQERLRQLAELIAGKDIELLRALLEIKELDKEIADASKQTAENTAKLEVRGALGFSYRDQLTTDLIASGTGA